MNEAGEKLYEDAVALIAERQLRARQTSSGQPVGNPGAWLVKAADTIRGQYRNTVEHLNLDRYPSGAQLADRLENGAPKPATQAGWRSDKPWCPECEGNTWVYSHVENGAEYVKRCERCYL